MTRLPSSDNAIVELRKFEDYVLSSTHLRGRHKARVFKEALGIDHTDAEWLRKAILEGIRDAPAIELVTDSFGTRWRADVQIARQGRRIVVRTVWIIGSGENVPRLVTCWVL